MLDVVPVLRDRQEAMVRANQILSRQMERVAGCSRHAATWTAARPNNKTPVAPSGGHFTLRWWRARRDSSTLHQPSWSRAWKSWSRRSGPP